MVLATKVFLLERSLPLGDIAHRLKGYSLLEREEVLGRVVEIGSRITDLRLEEGMLIGVLEEDFLISASYRGELFRIPVTIRTEFRFFSTKGRTFLVVMAKKARANRVANQLASLLSAEKGFVQEAWILPSTLRRYFEGRMETVKVVFFDNVRIPNVEKLSLYGSQLAETDLYREYLKLGTVWYVVFEPREGLVIGLTRNCIVTFFSKLSIEEAVEFISEEIVPLVEI